MCPDDPAAVADPLGDGTDRQNGGVGRQHGVGNEPSHPFEEFLLGGEVFDDGLDHQVCVLYRHSQVGDGGHRAAVRTGHLFGLCRCCVEDFDVGVGDDDVEARRGQDAGDAAAHEAGADDGGAGETARGQHAV